MRATRFSVTIGTLALVLGTAWAAEKASDEAIRADQKILEGTWQAVTMEVNGGVSEPYDTQKLTIINGSDGTWTFYSEGNEVAKGTSSINPLETPKTIDFTITEGEGEGNSYHGIYELQEDSRKLCFAPAEVNRPMDFYSAPGSQNIFIKFERKSTN
jgi:uncharacterized protein (TIGR03067 family)